MNYKEFEGLKYCKKCVMPQTVEGQNFNEEGLCITCQAQNVKNEINWQARKKELDKILLAAKENAGNNYDCIVPISGGKDSIYQLHVITQEYGLKPLAVTFNHNWFSKTGWNNLTTCLEKLNVDHIMFTPNRDLVNRIAKHSIETIGDCCWHCHAGVAAFTLQVAVKFGINLIIWGESGAEYGHQGAKLNNIVKFDRDYFTKLSAKLSLEEFACDYITLKDLYPFTVPSAEECEHLNGIHLGNYIPWDTEKQVQMMKDIYGWKGRETGGSYKDYKSVECAQAGMHDFLCYLKRGFGRTSIQASQDIRDGYIGREDAWELINKYERIEPKQLHWFLATIKMNSNEFRIAMDKLKNEVINSTSLNDNFWFPSVQEWRKITEEGKPYMTRLMDGED